MPQVAVTLSYRSPGPLLGRTAARTLRPAVGRTAKQPYARSTPHPPRPFLPRQSPGAKGSQAVMGAHV